MAPLRGRRLAENYRHFWDASYDWLDAYLQHPEDQSPAASDAARGTLSHSAARHSD